MSSIRFKKIYTIEITESVERPYIWYANKKGEQYKAEMKNSSGNNPPVFYVNPCQFVHLTDAKIIDEKIVEIYSKT